MDTLLQDIRVGTRNLLRTPAFAAIAVLMLALGIGLSTAVFTVADALLLRRLPVRDQDRLVVLGTETPTGTRWAIGLDEAREFARRTRSLEQVAFFSYYGALDKPIREGGRVTRLRRSQVSGAYFDVLGVQPALGRVLSPSDDVTGADPVVVLSHATWQRRFGGEGSVLGRRILTHDDGITYTVVGVMPQGFDYPRGTDFWAPVVAQTSTSAVELIALEAIGRLAPGASGVGARDEMTTFLGRAGAPPGEHNLHGVVHTLPQLIVGDTKPALLAFAAAAGLLLLITCINVANLLLVRGLARSREMAVRSALGGSQPRIVAQLMTESALLAVAGGVLGVAVAALAVQGFVGFAPAGVPRLDEVHLNATALTGAVAITAFAVLVFGLAPAVTTSRADLQQVLRSDTRQSAGRRSRLVTETLVAGQMALALLVLSSAGLIARSLIKLETATLSFDPSHLLIGELALPVEQFGDTPKQLALLERLVPRLAAIPGVQAVSPVVAVPFSQGWTGALSAEGQSAAEVAVNPMLNMEVVVPNYFTTFGIPILRGRSFTDADRDGALPVVVLSEGAARHFWPRGDAIGRRVLMGQKDTLTVVGVVPDTRYRDLREARPSIYFPLRQSFFGFVPTVLAIRTKGAPAEAVPAIRRVISETEPDVDLANAAPFGTFLAQPLAQPRLNALLLAVFALAGVALAAVGLFGVMATMVRRRTRELGIRMALGASARDVRRLVMRRGLAIASAGTAAGLLGALSVNRLLSGMLYEVSPTDAVTLAAVAGLLLGVATIASLIPARSSTRIDPAIALRAEG
jgi:predicted permease